LHLNIAQTASVGEDGKLIALQRAVGENVELNKCKRAMLHSQKLLK
jgi:hypothetical protein